MKRKQGLTTLSFPLLVGAALMANAGLAARADITVHCEKSVSRTPADSQAEAPPPAKQTYTAYFKGDKARIESDDGAVTLYDISAAKVFLLDQKQQTYSMETLKQLASETGGTPSGASVNLSVDAKVDLKKTDEKAIDATRKIA